MIFFCKRIEIEIVLIIFNTNLYLQTIFIFNCLNFCNWEILCLQVYIEQIKNTVAFTHSPNKCYNIFTKHLFLVVIGHSFIFHYFLLIYKKLTPQ